MRSYSGLKQIQLPPYKFLLATYNASYDNPYGERLLSRVFWYVAFKKGGMKFWVLFTEKYGMPYLMGKLPRGKSEQEYNELLDTLEKMIEDAVAVIPEDSSVDLKEAAGKSASAQIYQQLIKTCNAEISKAILGQTLSTEIGDKGSYAASKSHMDVRQNIIDADKKLVEKIINQLIAWICEINFNSPPPQFSLFQEEDVDKTLAERDQILVNTGIQFTPRYYIKNYGLSEEDFIISNAPVNLRENLPFLQFADPGISSINEIESRISQPAFSHSLAKKILRPLIDKIKNGNSYTQIMQSLAEQYPHLDTSELEEILNRIIFIAESEGHLKKT